MLVLSRKQKQQIKIGDNVVLTVLQVKGGSVRLGIEAPREVHVMRGELEDFRDESPMPQSVKPQTGKSQTETAEAPNQEILEVKFAPGTEPVGTESAGIMPTRLTEIADSIPSLNLPR